MTSHYEFFATAPRYTEDLLLNEIRLLGAEHARETVGGVSFSGDIALGYRVCLWSRIANHVLLNLAQTDIKSTEDLYEAIAAIDWAQHFDSTKSLAIDFFSSQSPIQHTQYGAQVCKDAIVDQFRHHTGSRPSVDKKSADIRINVHVKKHSASISLDLSGHSLHQRGYRAQTVTAPLKENLAAAFLMRANWPALLNESVALLDPMCGSGTLVIEAAWIAANIAPGLLRDDFGFIAWKQHNDTIWQQLRTQALAERREYSIPILGFDEDATAVRAAQSNAKLAGVSAMIQIERQAINQLVNRDYGNAGLVICNPPYGERLSENQQLLPVYDTLGRQLKQYFSGWKASIITNDPSLAKATGLHARRINKLYNGNLLCQLYHFDIYEQHQPSGTDTQTHTTEVDIDLENRLRKNLKRLQSWINKQHIQAFRLYDADIPEYNFALDIYDSGQRYAVLQEYAAPARIDVNKAQRRINTAKYTVLKTLQLTPQQLFVKLRKRQSGSAQYYKLSDNQHFHIVEEASCRFYVNFEDYLDTGLFLDHRLTRELIRNKASGKHFLNLFCYTGSASVYAALGGAKSTTSVDMSNTYINWCRDNFTLNNIPMTHHQIIKANCLEWLKQQKDKYDLIFVDPPTFSNSKNMDGIFDVQQHYDDLLRDCARILAPDGEIVFSTNHRRFKFDDSSFPDMQVSNISKQTIPFDFSRNDKIHQCWLIKFKTSR